MCVVRTILLALRDHFNVDDKAAIGYLDYSAESRKELAQKSNHWKCKLCPYDAAARNQTVNEEFQEQKSGKADKAQDFSLVWIGTILLILSLVTSYIYYNL